MSTKINEKADRQNGGEKSKRIKRSQQESGTRRKPIRLVSSLGEGKLLDRFQNAVGEKETKRKLREKSERERKSAKDKREREMAKFKAELNALLEDDVEQPVKQKENKSFVPKLKGTVKGKFEALEKQKMKEEKNKISTERQKRRTRDLLEKKRIEIELIEKKQKGMLIDEMEDQNSQAKPKKKPGKLGNNFEDIDRIRTEREQKKIELEKQMKLKTEFRAVKQFYAENNKADNFEDDISIIKQQPIIHKLKSNFDDIFREKEEKQRKELEERKRQQLEEEKQRFRLEKLAAENSEGSEISSESSFGSQSSCNQKVAFKPKRLSSSFTQFDVFEKQRAEEERNKLRDRRKALLEEEKRLFEASKQQDEEEAKKISPLSEPVKQSQKPGMLDSSLLQFDILTKQKLEEERKILQSKKAKLLEEEKNFLRLQKMAVNEESSNTSISGSEGSGDSNEDEIRTSSSKKKGGKKLTKRRPSKLTESRLNFDELERKRLEIERLEIQEQAHFRPGKLDRDRTNFDYLTIQKLKEEQKKIKDEKKRQLEEEKKLFQEERLKLQENVDDVTSGTKELLQSSRKAPQPKKLSSSLTQFDVLEQQRREEEREILQKEKADQLAREREMFERRKGEEQSELDEPDETKQGVDVPVLKRSVKKMDIRAKMEAVLKAQEEAERKRIEETKFTRMTVEQQEIFLAKQKQIEFLKEQLARVRDTDYSDDEYSSDDYSSDDSYENNDDTDASNNRFSDDDSDDDSEEEEEENYSDEEDNGEEDTSVYSGSTRSSSSGGYSGAPYFVQTLKNLTVTEGDPVRFDANINANPHPKITWYFKNRLIRNSSDYQYISKGTLYSLYMNESFLDDVGEYLCKAVNEKGSATSKAFLVVKDYIFQFGILLLKRLTTGPTLK